MDTAIHSRSDMIEEFAKFAHEAVDAIRERAVAVEITDSG